MEIILFLGSPQGAALIGLLVTLLTTISGFLGVKHRKAKNICDTLIRGIEIANSSETKNAIKALVIAQQGIKTPDFDSYVSKSTDAMKKLGINTVDKAVEEFGKEKILSKLFKLYEKV